MQQYVEMLRDIGIYLEDEEKEVLNQIVPDQQEYGLDYEQELHFKLNHRRIHRYDRCYRFRWTFAHQIAADGKAPAYCLSLLRKQISQADLHSRRAYECVRRSLKKLDAAKLYISIPLIIKALGGPSWVISHKQMRQISKKTKFFNRACARIGNEGQLYCRIFNTLAERLKRKRFPKMQFIMMHLFHKHGVVTPYKVYW
jgi:hypothetical protein